MGRTLHTIIKGGCLAAAALFSGHALAAEGGSGRADVLEPSTTWQLDYAEDKCRLAREFGEGEARVLLAIEQFGPSDTFTLSMAGKPLVAASRAKDVKLRFGSLPVDETLEFLAGDVAGYGRALFYSDVSVSAQIEPEPDNGDDDEVETSLLTIDTNAALQAKHIELAYRNRSVKLATGELSSPLKALNQCSLDLLADWGLDPERHKTLTRSSFWVNKADITQMIVNAYPMGALLEGRQGVFQMRVLIDAQGNVTNCALLHATVTKHLVSPACKAMQQARFEPALDVAGAPMASFYLIGIRYEIAK